MTLLLVDDDPDVRVILSDYLTSRGYRVLAARDARQAVRLLETEEPALIITDLSLPKVDGYAAIRLFKGNPETARTPVIAITASNVEADRQRAFDAGCDAFVDKPLTPQRLLRVIEDLLPADDADSTGVE